MRSTTLRQKRCAGVVCCLHYQLKSVIFDCFNPRAGTPRSIFTTITKGHFFWRIDHTLWPFYREIHWLETHAVRVVLIPVNLGCVAIDFCVAFMCESREFALVRNCC